MIIQREQFENYINQYGRLIITICLSFTKNYFDAEDLAQQTFLSAYKNIEKFHGENFKAWLTTIAANKCKDYIKSPVRKVGTLSKEDYECLKDPQNSPEDITMNKYTENDIYNLCNRLKEPYRTVAVNYFFRNIKLSDMARDTGENLKTLRTRLYRAKKLLKVLWKERFL